jgi:hypothetical protein
VFLLAATPTLAAIWCVPGFVTQDGPAHLYNASILAQSFDPASPFRNDYTVRWEPLPNWAGHLALAGLVAVLPPLDADRVMRTITFAGFAAAMVWLRWRVAGWRGSAMAAALAVLLALNMAWLFGFTSFLLGACLFPITLGTWWGGRHKLGPGRSAVLVVLLVLGYFCHLVSLGLTALGLVVLAAATPGRDRLARGGWTAASLAIPLVPLGLIYLDLARRGGRMQPVWRQLSDPTALASWSAQLSWVDPISLVSRWTLPGLESSSRWFGPLAPIVLLNLALALAGLATLLGRRAQPPERVADRTGWLVLAALLIVGGVIAPDSLGASHGEFLPQRIVLLGLVALLPILDLEPRGVAGRAAAVLLAAAVALQSAIVWDYALTSQRTAGALLRAGDAVGRGQRVATLLIDIRGRFRANPLLHADNLLGVGTGNIIWNNYETTHYYFPVQFRPELDRPDATELERVAITDQDAGLRAELWNRLIERHHASIDRVVVWGSDPQLDAINERWFQTIDHEGKVRVLRPRPEADASREVP